MREFDTTNVSTKDLAAILGMSRDAVTRLNRQGVIQQNGLARGKYDLRQALHAYLTYVKDSKGDESNVKLNQQRERKLRLANDRVEGGLVAVTDAAEVFTTYARNFREYVMGELPGMAARIAETSDPREVANIMQGDLQDISKTVTDGVLRALDDGCKN